MVGGSQVMQFDMDILECQLDRSRAALIGDVQRAVVELQLEDRQAEWVAGRVGGNRPVEQIGDVEALVRRANEMHHRPLDAQLLHHRRQPKQRSPRHRETQVADLEEGL